MRTSFSQVVHNEKNSVLTYKEEENDKAHMAKG